VGKEAHGRGPSSYVRRRPEEFGKEPRRSLYQVLISLNCVFDASLVPETCVELPSLPE
jgi:hypothetical protein